MDIGLSAYTRLFALVVHTGNQLDLFHYGGASEGFERDCDGDFDAHGLFLARDRKRFHDGWPDVAGHYAESLESYHHFFPGCFLGELPFLELGRLFIDVHRNISVGTSDDYESKKDH